MVKFDFEFRLLMAFSAVMMLVAMLSGLTWSHANSAATAASKVEQALEVLNHLAHIRSHTVQVELNTQAYRMTGNPVNLTERNATIAERELLMQRLRIETADNPAQQATWGELRSTLDERLRISRQVEHLRSTEGQEAATAYVALAPLQVTRERTNRLLADMESVERALLKQRSDEHKNAGLLMFWSEIVVSSIFMLLFVLTYRVMRQRLKRLQHSHSVLEESEAELQMRVEEGIYRLRESHEHLTNVINSVPALIAYVDAQQRYVYVNAQYQARFAPDKADITGQSVSEILGEDRYRVASPMIDKVLQGQPQSYDWEPFPGVWQVIHYLPKLDEQGAVAGYYVLGTDVTERKAHERELARVANYDPLTQLPNRRLLSDRLNQMILHAQRSEKIGAICFLDLDGFKLINDQHGHEVGDQLLVGVARNLTSALRAHDTLARLGGDEFVLLLSDLDSPHECAVILSRVLQTVRQPVNAGGHVISISASIGVTLYPHDSADPDTLLRHADQTMYLAKQAGKNRYQLFDPEVDRKTQSRHELLAQMRTALANGEFVLFYQPKVDLVGGDVVGAEALIRWQHPQRGLLPPGEFLPHLSGTDVEWLFGEWVLATALQQMQTWARAGMVMKISVNISASHLLHAGFHEHLAHVLSQHPGVAAGDLELEVLETAAIEDIQLAQNVMRRCMELGVRFSLDDFGTGYSSLTYLRKLPIHAIKIDQSFVRDMLVDPEDMSIVQSVIQLARAFHRQVVAEGVETLAHGSHLLAMGCHLAQGYGIARPMPADQLMAWRIQWLAAGAWRRDLQPVDGFPR